MILTRPIAALKKTNIAAIRFTDKNLSTSLIYNKACKKALHIHASMYEKLLPDPDKKIEVGSDKFDKFNYPIIFKTLFK